MTILPPLRGVYVYCEGECYAILKTVANQYKIKKGQEVSRELLEKLLGNTLTRVTLMFEAFKSEN